MIEVEPVQNEDDDLFTEPGDENKSKEPTATDIDTLASGIADFYIGLRKRKIPSRYAFKLTNVFMQYCIAGR